jgi:hypothetical protein
MKHLNIAIDSGAHSLYRNTFSPGQLGFYRDRYNADYSYLKTKKFKDYLEDYIDLLLEHEDNLEMYVSLDIIFNAKASWEIQQYMESCGLNPIPVFHQGEDWKYLKRYVDNYEYMGMGGLAQNTSAKAYAAFADQAFKIICDKHGVPRTRVHGFAMTSIQLMKRYPWYSCDSSTWISLSRNGWARFPRFKKDGEYDWLGKPIAWRFTERASHSKVHIDKQPGLHKDFMEEYLQETFQFTMEDLKTYIGRDCCNIGHTLLTGEALKKYYADRWGYEIGGNIYLAGTGLLLSNTAAFKRVMSIASRPLAKGTNRHYLGSFFYKREFDKAIAALRPSKRRKLRGL